MDAAHFRGFNPALVGIQHRSRRGGPQLTVLVTFFVLVFCRAKKVVKTTKSVYIVIAFLHLQQTQKDLKDRAEEDGSMKKGRRYDRGGKVFEEV